MEGFFTSLSFVIDVEAAVEILRGAGSTESDIPLYLYLLYRRYMTPALT